MLFVGGSDQPSKHSGPYQFRSLPIDYSVTSAYKGSGAPATPVSITDHPTSPIYLQRGTSHKNPPRPSFQPEKTTPSPGNRPRTHSTSSYSANGRRPVPAPRTSICSHRSESSDYQTIDHSMPDVQVTEGMSPGNFAFGQSFLYPEIMDPALKENAFSRASTLPISAQRPSLESDFPTKQRSKSPDNLTPRPQRNQTVDAGSQYDTGSNSASIASSLEFKSSRANSKRGASAQLIRRFNSRTSLTDVEKAERRKSDLLESSPYPQLYNLAMDDEDIKPTHSPKTNKRTQLGSASISETPKKTHVVVDQPPIPISTISTAVGVSADPIYSQIRKVPAGAGGSNGVTNIGEGVSSEARPLPPTVSTFGVRNGDNNKTSGASMGVAPMNFSRDISGGLVFTPVNPPPHASGAGERAASPIYERIGDLSDSLPPSPQHGSNMWQQGFSHTYNSFSRQRGTVTSSGVHGLLRLSNTQHLSL